MGSIFRLADAAAAEKVFLCGQTETPPHTRIKKASINTTEWVAWEYAETAVSAASSIKHQVSGIKIIAIEQAKNSVDYKQLSVKGNAAFIVGAEVAGIPKSILRKCDVIAEIPMKGKKESLNVSVAMGVALYQMLVD